jgi:hypothetical protein
MRWQLVRELVDRGLQGEHPGALAGRPHPGGRRHVQAREPVRRAPVRAAVHHAGGGRGLLGELLQARALRDGVVADRDDRAVGRGAEPDVLDRRRPVAGQREHLAPAQRELDRPPGELGAERGEHRLRARGALGAEAAADVVREHAHALGLEAEHLRDRAALARDALARVVQDQVAVLPRGHAGVRLHRVVVQHGRLVGHVNDRVGRGEPGVEVADRGVGLVAAVDAVGRVQGRVVGTQHHVVRRGLVGDLEPAGARARRLERVREHERHDLAAVDDLVGLQDEQLAVVDGLEPRRVAVVDDVADARQLTDAGDARPGVRGLDGPAVEQALRVALERVGGTALDLGGALDAAERGADRAVGDGHHASSSPRVRTSRLRASGTLKALSRSGRA